MNRENDNEHIAGDATLRPGHPMYDTIENAYRAFDLPKPAQTGVCVGCCMEPEIERDFFTPAIRELPLEYVRDWFFAASGPDLARDTWGYLLPRVLEVLAAGEYPATVGLEVSLSRFPTGEKHRWSEAQWSVLDRFQRQYLHHYALTSDEFLDDALCMFGNANWPLDDLFAQVAAWPDELLAERLWRDWCQGGNHSIWLTAFWTVEGSKRAYAFYTSLALGERMTDLGLDPATPPALADEALAVADVIWSHEGP